VLTVSTPDRGNLLSQSGRPSRQVETPEPGVVPNDVTEALDRTRGRLGAFATRIVWFPEVGSTNDIAARLAESGASEGTVVVAEAQSAGRGRLGRSWSSPEGAGLYVSTVLRPGQRAAALLTIGAGVAVCEGIRAATGLTPDLKWPNDALIAGRKVAGVLAEASAAEGALQYVVLGVGINLAPAPHAPDIAERATSLEAELGRPVDRGLVLAELLSALANRYSEIQRGETAATIRAWRLLASATLSRAVEWESGGTQQRGVARDIDESGALLVDTPGGRTRVIAGTVSWTQ
jgi:BirA family transcriptional regulator, biotin operon repressor / biotin---[acetyl-CoA-carboxylase] ligase